MDEEKLREALEELHLKLLRLSPADGLIKEKGDALAAHIRDALDQEDLSAYHFAWANMLSDEVTSFRDAHPKVAELMDSVRNLLSSIGI